MSNIVTIGAMGLALASSIQGCINEITDQSAKPSKTYAVVVGMENSKYAGRCDGAGYDSERMYNLISNYTQNIVKYRDDEAIKEVVVKALMNAIDKSGDEGLVIFSYSGHGGSDPFPDTGIEETDGKDEYLLLWDTYLRDNEIWNIISRSKSRIFLLFDCCHSQSMMKCPSFKITPPLGWDHTMNDKVKFSMLCWSGCPDDTYSYGSSSGGQFTNALLRHFNKDKTYETLWNEIKNDKTLRSYENPQSTVLGKGFEGVAVFR